MFALLSLIPADLLFAPAPFTPSALASADFDRDGRADLVVAGLDGNAVRVLLSTGKKVDLAVDSTPLALATGDVNGDGRPDVAVATASYVAVFVARAGGVFERAVKYGTAEPPISIALGDVNGDGRADVILLGARTQHVLVSLTTADGGLQPPVSYAFGRIPTAVAVGDFNQDGRTDLVVADAGTNELLLLLGNGDGTFEDAGSYAAGPLPRALTTGDFNGDGIADVAAANIGDHTLHLLLGRSGGTLEASESFDIGAGWTAIAAADLEGRGKADLVWAHANAAALSTRRGDLAKLAAPRVVSGSSTTLAIAPTGSATFGQPVMFTANVAPASASGKVTFFDGTTILGVSTLTSGQATLSSTFVTVGNRTLRALYGGDLTDASSISSPVPLAVSTKRATTFAPAPTSPFPTGGNPQAIIMADFNGDGKTDFAVANMDTNNITVLLGDGHGGFTPAAGSPFAVGMGPVSIAAGDFNGDGNTDLAVAEFTTNDVAILLGDGSGTLKVAGHVSLPMLSGPFFVAVGDFNGDGKADLAVANAYVNNVTILLGDGSGGFIQPNGSPFMVGGGPDSIAVGDFNGDGKADLATANSYAGTLTVLLGDGHGGFAQAVGSPLTVGMTPTSVATGDFDGDGRADLAVCNFDSNNLTVLLGNGSGGFTTSTLPVGTQPTSVTVSDFNGDGAPDLAVANNGSNDVTVLLGNGQGGFTAANGNPFQAGGGPASVVAGEFNGDGKADLAIANDSDNTVAVLLGSGSGSLITTTTTLGAAPNPSTLGQNVLLTATITPSSAAGTVTFFDSTSMLGQSAVTSGTATFNTSGLGAGAHTLHASYAGDAADLPSASGNVSLTVNGPPQLNITKNHTENFQTSEQGATYTITVSNSGSGPTSGAVTVTDTLPTGMTLVSMAGAAWNCSTNTCMRADALSAGGTYPAITVTVNVASNAPSQVTNQASVSGGGAPSANAMDPTTITQLLPALGITKTHVGNFSVSQQGALYTVTVSNTGTAATSGTVTVTETIPAGLVLVSMAGTGWSCSANTCMRSDPLGSGASYPAIAVTVNVASNAPSQVTNQVSVSGGGAPAANAMDPTTITQLLPALGITKMHTGNFRLSQQGALYTVTVSNSGTAATSGTVTVTESIPAGLVLVSMAGTGWGCVSNTCMRSDPLGSGASYPAITVTVNVASNAPSQVMNQVGVSGGGSAGANAMDPTTISPATHAAGDFDGNGVPDLVWQNDASRQAAVWYLGGPQGSLFQSFRWLDPIGQPGWSVVTVADLNRDGVPDILWQNDSTQQVVVWYMGGLQGSQFVNWAWLQISPQAGWKLIGAADLNGDGIPDLIWQNVPAGRTPVGPNIPSAQLAAWYMGGADGSQFESFGLLPTAASGWSAVGMADFDGDGHPDLVWQNATTRQAVVWYMGGPQGNQMLNWAWLQPLTNTSTWKIVGVADLDGNGHPDLIWQEDTSRSVVVWYMGGPQGNQASGAASIAGTTTGWRALMTH